MKQVQRIVPAQKVNMGGILLDQPLPAAGLDMVDPFLLIHHWKSVLPGGQTQKDAGVGPHPHRGFSPVTLVFKGGVHHRDSRGNDSVVKAGGTQWMNAGMGIVHSERPNKELVTEGGEFEFIQFWANTPAEFKMNPPKYHALHEENTPSFMSEDGKSKVSVVTGNINEVNGPIQAHSPMLVLRIEMEANSKLAFGVPSNYHTLLYQLSGDTVVNEQSVSDKDMVLFKNNAGEQVKLESSRPTTAILLAGVPLNEKVVSYGPFVMNSQSEIMEAMRDAQMGKMGVLIEEF